MNVMGRKSGTVEQQNFDGGAVEMGGFTSQLRPKKPKTPALPRADEEDEYDDASSDTTSSWESVDETGYDAAWETLDEVFEAACTQLQSQGWQRLAVNDRRKELEDAVLALDKEEQEALEAEFQAAREKEEYEAAMRSMEREQAEMEEAERAAAKELAEAEEAERLAAKERAEAEEAAREAQREIEEAEAAEAEYRREEEEAVAAEEYARKMLKAAEEAEAWAGIHCSSGIRHAVLQGVPYFTCQIAHLYIPKGTSKSPGKHVRFVGDHGECNLVKFLLSPKVSPCVLLPPRRGRLTE